MKLTDSVITIKGVGEKAAQRLEKLGITSVGDLLCHYPRAYRTFEAPLPIAALSDGSVQVGAMCAVEGTIGQIAPPIRARGFLLLTCTIRDPSGTMRLKWFNSPYLRRQLLSGGRFVFYGRLEKKEGQPVLLQPRLLKQDEYRRLMYTPQPVYALTDGLTNHAISKAVAAAFAALEWDEDPLPRKVRREHGLMKRKDALYEVHIPKTLETAEQARERLVFDEFFLFLLLLTQAREARAREENRFPMTKTDACDRLLAGLPYALTGAQTRVLGEIFSDMTGKGTMCRLVQGDVGSGKTIVAVLAMVLAASNGWQACMMAPTEVLAQQHFTLIRALLQAYVPELHVILLTGSVTGVKRKEAYEAIRIHAVDLIVGTHAVLQAGVQYDRLGLVVTDELHRFGVRQREQLAEKGNSPHVLVMSATPIPRTLALLLYGDLELSVVDERPANRLPVKNCVVGQSYRPNAYRFIERQVAEGRQAFVICPMVEENDELEAESVTEYAQTLREALPAHISIELLHGRMTPRVKNAVMERFASGEIQILVSTTVIEVGVDVPNATVMMVENAERFGLAQLHQLRGRVGRGAQQAYCIFVSGSDKPETMERLELLNCSNDGFFIAQEDLRLRGPGELTGVRQSGALGFRLADIYRDAELLQKAAAAVQALDETEQAAALCAMETFCACELQALRA